MNKIYLVLSNLKHNGEDFLKGTLFEGAEETFKQLAEAGVLKVIEGAQTLEEAAAIVKAEVETAAAQAEAVAAANVKKDVWAPTKTAEPAAEEKAPETAPEAQTQETASAAEQKQPETPAAPQVGAGDVEPAVAPSGDNL